MKRTHLLMGIPELHLDAFSPEAGRMKLYCGGGGGGGDNGAAERARQEAQRQAVHFSALYGQKLNPYRA